MIKNKSTAEIGKWEFWMEGSRIAVEGNASSSLENMVGAEYTGPKGEKRWCHNCKIGDLSLRIYLKKYGGWKKETILSSQKTCAMEWVRPEKNNSVLFWA
jgi:hypothetical protein